MMDEFIRDCLNFYQGCIDIRISKIVNNIIEFIIYGMENYPTMTNLEFEDLFGVKKNER